jgi:bacterioferritin-associated ferredoxin
MIVCLCNAMSEEQVRAAIAAGASRPNEVYACCGGRARCGCCARAVLGILRDEGRGNSA